ncbi:hypothetical protein L1047_02300 [Synechococcus sp. Nb3U1]|uniref:hypothetical protein n=1 Tax=Synechococcus sp. Nb3U1 TaxID=1914529 RepID=UPI001F467C89|nr:hypothetical protein [Synechococcus sp. Nb3U1]MCF2970026.1 hypothetical protein [Synechococcus sp. Nb3U1]
MTLILGITLNGIPSLEPKAAAQTASSFRPGPWQPIARINPTQPIQIRILNQAGSLLEYGLTGPRDDVESLLAGDAVVLQIDQFPAYLTINTLERSALNYGLSAEGNQLSLEVRKINDVNGDRTLNVDDQGGIYIY